MIKFSETCKICGIESNTGSWDVCANCQLKASEKGYCQKCGNKKGHKPECPNYIPNATEIHRVAKLNPSLSAEAIADNYISVRRPNQEKLVREKIIQEVDKTRNAR